MSSAISCQRLHDIRKISIGCGATDSKFHRLPVVHNACVLSSINHKFLPLRKRNFALNHNLVLFCFNHNFVAEVVQFAFNFYFFFQKLFLNNKQHPQVLLYKGSREDNPSPTQVKLRFTWGKNKPKCKMQLAAVE